MTLLLALYALAGFALAPRMLRSALIENCQKFLHLTPSVGDIRLNPFNFQLEVKDFAIADAGGTQLVGFQRFFVDFELSSLWHHAYVFKDIELLGPHVNASVAPDGALNLIQLQPKGASPEPQLGKKTEPLPAVEVGSLRVSRGIVTYHDRSRPSEFDARLEPINFELRKFSTGADGGRFTFTGSSRLGERLEWHGHVSVQPIESDGEFRIDGLRARSLWDYLKDSLGFVINSGSIDLQANYRFSLKDGVDLKADLSKATLTAFQLRPKGSDLDWLMIPELTLSGGTVNLRRREAHVDSLLIAGLQLLTWMEPDGSINLSKLSGSPAVNTAPAAPTGAPANGGSPALAGIKPWTFDLHHFELRDARISAEDRGRHPVVKVLLAPLSLKLTDASLNLSKPWGLGLTTRINGGGELAAEGDLTPQPLAANLRVVLKQIDLTVAQPYLAQFTAITLRSGRFNADAKLRYGAQNPTLLVTGNVSVEKLQTIDNDMHNDFVDWERVDVLGLNYQHDPDRLIIEKIVARKAYARVIIEPDLSLNVKRVLSAPVGAALALASVPVPAAKANASMPVASSNSMPISIKKIVLQSCQANFSDLSVTPHFSTGIQKLDGTVTGLSSQAASRAKIDLHGSVNAFSPVSITGDANVLSANLYTDLALSFRNMELSTFNPYSGKFAGYNITKGKLTTELHYKVDGRKLDAQHHIIVDQLEFGAKTASKDAVSLPVKLAVALLKDRNGVIDLDLPVKGTLDDPQFRLGPIIWKVLLNILVKAVTAPFALLGALFGGGPDMQFVDFPAGIATLDTAAADRLKSVTKALIGRPQLKIELPIAVFPALDRPALTNAKFTALVGDQPDPSKKLAVLMQVYEKTVGSKAKFPEGVTSLKSKPEMLSAKVDFLTSEVRSHIAISDEELKSLATARAAALQTALLSETSVDPARVFLVVNDKVKNQSGQVRLELSLQ